MSKVKNKDIADDIFQDTFIKAIKSLKKGTYNEEGKFLPWIFRIAHNLIIDHFRRIKNQKTVNHREDYNLFDFIEDRSLTAEKKIIKKEIFNDLTRLIDLLPDSQKTVLQLRYYEEKSFKEIAELCDISINTALGRMRYALLNLRKFSIEKKINLEM
tara:strand:+ start:804 stop:1274 length:471 start_codon:yes stop_codon:yes gene_type:complete